MPLTYTKQILSGSTSGKLIEVNSTSSPGTTIHTVGPTATTGREEIYLYAVNAGSAGAELTIEFGGTATADQIKQTLNPIDGLTPLVPGIPLTATSSIVRAFATATGLFRIGGWADRAT